jgi:hypothetical protein
LTLVALVFSGAAFFRSGRADKRDLFLRIHEMLLDPEVVRGRRRLYKITTREQAEHLHDNPDDYTRVHRALALFDLLAKYEHYGWIDERTALDEWADSLARAKPPAELFIAARAREVGVRSWPDFLDLAGRAERYERGNYSPRRFRRRIWRRRPRPLLLGTGER